MNANSMLALQIKKLTENTTKQKEELDAMKCNIANILSLLQDTTIRNNANHQCSGYGGRGNR
eukprot:5742557-Ditylum_brightwellii.AAC.1